MSGLKNGSLVMNGKNGEKRSSLSQTKAKYHQIIQNLTGEREENSIGINSVESSSEAGGSEIRSSRMELESKDSRKDATPEEIRQYVKQFKVEVEEKFKGSKTNEKYVFKRTKSYDESISAVISLAEVEKYDLEAQNIVPRYKDSDKRDPKVIADILHEVGRIEKNCLEGILRCNNSNLLKLLYDSVKERVEPETPVVETESPLRLKGLRVVHRDSQDLPKRTESSRGSGSNREHHIQESTNKKISARGRKKKSSVKLNNFIESKKHGSKEQMKISEDKPNVKSLSNLNNGNKISVVTLNSSSKNTADDYHNNKALLFKNTSSGLKGVPSPKRKSGSITKTKAVAQKLNSGIPYYNKKIQSPQLGKSKEGLPNHYSKGSNLTLFTNNTLLSTLSPKSNISLSTLKSNSRSRSRYSKSRQSGNISKRTPDGARSSQLQFKVGSKILKNIRREEIEESGGSSAKFGRPVASKKSIYAQQKPVPPGKGAKSIPKKRPASSRNNVMHALSKKKRSSKKKITPEPTGVVSLGSQNKYLQTLSNVNWRRRLEKLL